MISNRHQVIEPGTFLSSIGHCIRPKLVGHLDAVKTIAVAGVPMERGVRFSRAQLHRGIDVAEYLDGLAINYPLSVQGS
jgi:hypothetical protein